MVLRVRGIDGGLHFIERERLRRVDALVAAARAVDLDPIRSGGDARLCLLAIIGSGPACARSGDALARDEHSWPDHLAHVDQIAHRVVDLVAGANRLRCRESRRRNQREREPCQTYPLYPTHPRCLTHATHLTHATGPACLPSVHDAYLAVASANCAAICLARPSGATTRA